MIVVPVGHHRAAVGEQRVVRVHHALGHAGGARGEGEVHDLVGIGDRRYFARRTRTGEWRALRSEHGLHVGKRLRRSDDVFSLRDERRGARALEELHDLGDGVVLVQRRVADVAVPRAGEQRHHALGARGQPHGDALAAPHAGPVQARGQRVDPGEQLAPAEAQARVAQRVRPRSLGGVPLQQRVEGVLAPRARGVMARRLLRVEQGEEGVHAASGRTSLDRACACRERLRRARATPRFRGSRAATGRAPCAPGPRRRRGAR